MGKEKKDIDLNRYKDPEGLSVKDMDFGLWLSKNRKLFTRLIIIFLIALSAFFFIYSSYNYVIYFLDKNKNGLVDANNQLISPRNVTGEIEVSSLKVLKVNNSYDLTVKIINPNEKFLANIEYCFVQVDEEVACGSDFILPGGEKHVLALNKDLDSSTRQVQFKITKASWQRVNAHDIPDWEKFENEMINFNIENINFDSASESGLSEKLSLNALEFVINNNSAYGYYEVPLNVLLFNGLELVGVNTYLAGDFGAGERKNIRMTWPGNLPIVSRVEIIPNINILDNSVYSKYLGE